MLDGRFYRLEAGEGLPKGLGDHLPDLLWVPTESLAEPPSSGSSPVLLRGFPLGEPLRPVTLVSGGHEGSLRLHFDVATTADAILLERYHSGLQPTLEMRLPFNYSRLPWWLRGLGRALRSPSLNREAEVLFPAGDPSMVVDWLDELAHWAGSPGSSRRMAAGWPEGYRAALAISHDVDTGWLFDHPAWIDRLCDLEERHGLLGAWYCVPWHSDSRAADSGLRRLLERGCEIGCHGYNHDGKWPLLQGRAFEARLDLVRRFRDRWHIRGFRSEWLWRTPAFLERIGEEFDYDSSVSSVSSLFTSASRNGCATSFPYRTHGGGVELPLTLPMDDDRQLRGQPCAEFWRSQVERSRRIIERGGMVMISLHPHPHQSATEESLETLEATLEELVAIPGLWAARPDAIADWARSRLQSRPDG